MDDLDVRLYKLNCASAEWHEATGEDFPNAQRRFMEALQWFQGNNIALETVTMLHTKGSTSWVKRSS